MLENCLKLGSLHDRYVRELKDLYSAEDVVQETLQEDCQRHDQGRAQTEERTNRRVVGALPAATMQES